MDIKSFLNGMNKDSISRLGSMMSTPAGQELMKKLQNVNKNALMKHLSTINEGNVSKEDLVKMMSNDPQLIKKLSDFLDKR